MILSVVQQRFHYTYLPITYVSSLLIFTHLFLKVVYFSISTPKILHIDILNYLFNNSNMYITSESGSDTSFLFRLWGFFSLLSDIPCSFSLKAKYVVLVNRH